ncbi:hypothetical protein CAG70_02510 [Photobacterium halotolerans]|uniref:hypothetical protein n=1 Tax=Photobacterium halotolerans TaxID=265726 RepID=UPI001373170B|nr:hypothetical protein [Photobacterium halotolerans]NAX45875.1 hypothetical protein [Photobacterium halotolerans]
MRMCVWLSVLWLSALTPAVAGFGLPGRLVTAEQLGLAPRVIPVMNGRQYLTRDDELLVKEVLENGSTWHIYRPTRAFSTTEPSYHSAADVWGMLPVASVTVVTNDDQGSRLAVTAGMQEIRPGDRLLRPTAPRSAEPSEVPPGAVRVLGGLQDHHYMQDWLVLDHGAEHGLEPGQRWRIEHELLGQRLVADVEIGDTLDQFSLAQVISSQGPIKIGDIAKRIEREREHE